MSKYNKLKHLIEKEQEPLPNNFWETVASHIPTYQKRKRHMLLWFFPAILLMAASILFVKNYLELMINPSVTEVPFQNKGNNDQKTAADVPLNEDSGNNVIASSQDFMDQKLESAHVSKSTLDVEPQNNSLDNNQENLKKYSKTISSKTIDLISTTQSSEVQSKETEDIQFVAKQEIKIPDNESNQIGTLTSNYESGYEEKNDIETVNFDRAILGDLPPIDELRAYLIGGHRVALANSHIIDVPYIESSNSRLSVTLGYKVLWFKRDLYSKFQSVIIENRNTYEKDFYSHEVEADLTYRLSRHFDVSWGGRYTRIQELFDYSESFAKTSGLIVSRSLKITEHTNTIEMIDGFASMGFMLPLEKFCVKLKNSIGINVSNTQQGIYVNLDQRKSAINQDFELKKSVGLNHEVSLDVSVPIYSTFRLGVSSGHRYYVGNFMNVNNDFYLNYKGFYVGLYGNYAL